MIAVWMVRLSVWTVLTGASLLVVSAIGSLIRLEWTFITSWGPWWRVGALAIGIAWVGWMIAVENEEDEENGRGE